MCKMLLLCGKGKNPAQSGARKPRNLSEHGWIGWGEESL
jgi:hypothetical protein